MSNFRSEQDWMGRVRLEASDGGNAKFYDLLKKKVEDRKAGWEHESAGGDFNRDDLARLIDSAFSLLEFIDNCKTREGQAPE